MRRLWSFVRRRWKGIAWGVALLALTNAAAMTIPQLFRFAIDDINASGDLTDLRSIALTMILIAAGGAVFRTLSRIHLFHAARDVEKDLRCAYYEHLAGQAPSFFEAHPSGDLMSRATNDLTQVRLMLGPGVLNVVNTTIAYSVAIPLMSAISWKLTLLTLAVYPPCLFAMRHLARKLFLQTRAQQREMGLISNFVQENLAGAHVIRAFNHESQREARFDVLNDSYYRASVRLSIVRAWLFRGVMIMGSLGVMLAVLFGALDALKGRITVGELVALVEYMALLAWPTFALGWVLSTIQRGRAAMTRINEILDIAPAIRSGDFCDSAVEPRIQIDELDAGYGDERVLRGVSLSVEPGTTLGIVGPVGSGKSTLARAMMRLVDVPKGAIFVGGQDIVSWELDALRGLFGYTPQAHTLFSKTLAENVRFGRPDAGEDDVASALEAASFDPVSQGLPKGLETPVGERGITLSGGQKQRTALARALLLDPPILVLDDALASVDAETEARIISNLRELRQGKTTVIIAHRISAVAHSEQIVVLDDGQVVERGSDRELRESGGVYANLAQRQELENVDDLAREAG